MGGLFSKGKNVNSPAKKAVWMGEHSAPSSGQKSAPITSDNQYENVFMQRLKHQFEKEMEIFILNQIVMSVMFFENFDVNMQHFTPTSISETEIDLNRGLFHDQKKIIMPDIIYSHVNERVQFQPHHGPKKYVSEPLVPQRMFITHENIEVSEPEGELYNQIDKPHVAVMIEESKNKGFVKLKVDPSHDGSIKSKVSTISTVSSTSQESFENHSRSSKSGDDKNGDDKNGEHKESFNGEKNTNPEKILFEEEPQPSTSHQSEDIYMYERINDTRIPRPLEIVDKFSLKYPSDWIKGIKFKNLKDMTEDDETSNKNGDEEDDLFITHYYCDSDVFMRHFIHHVFPSSLGKSLQFPDENIQKATYITGVVLCDKPDHLGNLINCEVIPSIRIHWLPKVELEFHRRNRTEQIDNRLNKIIKWPTPIMLTDLTQNLDSVVIARGYNQKRGNNKECHLEWEVAFPKPERYLQSRMTHAQVRAFLIILTLFKTYIEPLTEKKGLLIDHIRTLMFWECEENYKDWSERTLGSKILKVLKKLYSHLGKSNLPDYFIKPKNIFENIPGKFLHLAQEKVHRIQENPTMHFIQALRNLRYSHNFYPELDFKELHQILMKDGMETINAPLYMTVVKDRKNNPVKEKQMDQHQYWQARMMEKNKKEAEKKKLENAKTVENKLRASVDSIKMDFDKFNSFDMLKKLSVVIFFIKHFIAMGKKSLELASARQARFFFKQAEYLCNLLDNIPAAIEDAEKYSEIIRGLQENSEAMAHREMQDAPPDIPSRNSIFNPATYPKEILLTNSSISIQNITTNFNLGAAPSSSGKVAPSSSVKINGVVKSVSMKKTVSVGEEVVKPKKVATFKEEVEIM